MNPNYSRDNPRVRARRQRESTIRRVCFVVIVLLIASIGSLIWRRAALSKLEGYPESAPAATDPSVVADSLISRGRDGVRRRSLVTSILFGEREVIPLNAKGEYVPGREAVFMLDYTGPPEREAITLKQSYPDHLRASPILGSKIQSLEGDTKAEPLRTGDR